MSVALAGGTLHIADTNTGCPLGTNGQQGIRFGCSRMAMTWALADIDSKDTIGAELRWLLGQHRRRPHRGMQQEGDQLGNLGIGRHGVPLMAVIRRTGSQWPGEDSFRYRHHRPRFGLKLAKVFHGNRMAADLVLSELRKIFQAQAARPDFRGSIRLTVGDVQRLADLLGTSRPQFYDELAIRLARGFHTSELTFEFCDAVMNGIHDVMANADERRPELFWKVYLAFDEGEYHHDHNRLDDPVEAYTRPLIAQILSSVSDNPS